MVEAKTAAVLGYIGANVRRLRLRQKLTQETLAERAGISAVHLQRIEAGTSNMRVGIVVAVAAALGVAPGSLFRKATRPHRPPGRPARNRSRRK